MPRRGLTVLTLAVPSHRSLEAIRALKGIRVASWIETRRRPGSDPDEVRIIVHAILRRRETDENVLIRSMETALDNVGLPFLMRNSRMAWSFDLVQQSIFGPQGRPLGIDLWVQDEADAARQLDSVAPQLGLPRRQLLLGPPVDPWPEFVEITGEEETNGSDAPAKQGSTARASSSTKTAGSSGRARQSGPKKSVTQSTSRSRPSPSKPASAPAAAKAAPAASAKSRAVKAAASEDDAREVAAAAAKSATSTKAAAKATTTASATKTSASATAVAAPSTKRGAEATRATPKDDAPAAAAETGTRPQGGTTKSAEKTEGPGHDKQAAPPAEGSAAPTESTLSDDRSDELKAIVDRAEATLVAPSRRTPPSAHPEGCLNLASGSQQGTTVGAVATLPEPVPDVANLSASSATLAPCKVGGLLLGVWPATVVAPREPLSIATDSLPDAMVGTPYSATVEARGGAGPVDWTLRQDQLPPGMTSTESGASLTIGGSPTATGTFRFTVTVTDGNRAGGESATVDLEIGVGANVPGPPTNVSASAADESVVVSWEHPRFNGGAPVTAYDVFADGTRVASTDDASTSVLVGNLVNDQTYSFTVAASNSAGTGPKSFPAVRVAPKAPLRVSADALPGAVVGKPYTASIRSSGGTAPETWTVRPDTLPPGLSVVVTDASAEISGTPLSAGTFEVEVEVEDSTRPEPERASAALAVVVAPDVPGVPANVIAMAGDACALLSWEPPLSTGGAPITGYDVYDGKNRVASTDGTTTSVTVEKLANGTGYSFEVVALNIAGTGPRSAPVEVTPVEAPAPGWMKMHAAATPPGRSAACMIYMPAAGDVLLFGGASGAGQTFSDTWAYNFESRTWTEKSPAVCPPARTGGSMVHDPTSGRVLLFGGVGRSGFLADLWAYDPQEDSWSELDPKNSPLPRAGVALASMPDGRVVLFGGVSYNGLLSDTWVYEPSTNAWNKRSPERSPSTRHGAAMACFPTTGEVVLFGGEGAGGLLGDTWSYDSKTDRWSKYSPQTAPPALQGAAMEFDPRSRDLVLFGGQGESGFVADLWGLDPMGRVWSSFSPSSGPPDRGAPSLAFNPTENVFVIFGGWDGDAFLADTWMLEA
jgi:N-acetylneuraminic acid mutarotase